MPLWALLTPIVAAVVAVAALVFSFAVGWLAIIPSVVLIAVVIVAVHHAEIVAHRLGEPFGTLVLALAVTIIEVALILSMMFAGGAEMKALARDTIFSAIMIICNGVVGLCLLLGALRHHEQSFRIDGANTGLSALIALATLSLVLPTFTTSSAGGTYTTAQLIFAATMSLLLWAVYVFIQTVRHRDYFLPAENPADEEAHAAPPSARLAWASFALLIVALAATVALAKALSPAIEAAVMAAGAPQTVIGIAIAMLVLAPETLASVRAARADRLQTSLNLAFGSALASIGLTIPAVAVVAIGTGMPLTLGLVGKDLVFLMLSFLVASVTLVSGRTHMMQGAVHLVIFAAYLFLALIP